MVKNVKHYVNENCLTANIKALNNWLDANPSASKERILKVMKRNYYVSKTIELSNSPLKFVQL